MYDFYYNKLKNTFGDKMTLLMTDTDSLMIHVQSEDVYQYMKDNIDIFDTSDYPRDHFLYDDKNKKVVGKMKDETNGVPISEFVGLRSKMYSFKCGDKEEKKAKGITRAVLKNDIRFETYKDILFSEKQNMVTMMSFRAHSHEIFCSKMNKTGLSSFDDKRYLLNATESLAYGHYSLRDTQPCEDELITDTSDMNSFFIDGFKVTPVQFM